MVNYSNFFTIKFMHAHWLIFIVNMWTDKFKIHATRQRTRAGNLTICYRKKQIEVSF